MDRNSWEAFLSSKTAVLAVQSSEVLCFARSRTVCLPGQRLLPVMRITFPARKGMSLVGTKGIPFFVIFRLNYG